MKLCKRFLAAVLTLVMLLTCSPFSLVFADETEVAPSVTLNDVDPDTTVGQSVLELVKLGIINGYEDGTFRADRTITRGEVAKIIITFLKQENIAFDTIPSGFQDVDGNNHWAKKYIKLAADQKIVNGYPDGTFRPDDPVKYTEIVKMLVCTLGFGAVAESRTTPDNLWYAGYLSIAAELGVLRNASMNNVEDFASRGVVSILTYNALKSKTADTNASGDVIINSDSALENIQGKEKVRGVVVGVHQTGLYNGSSGLSTRQISLETRDETITLEVPVGFDTMSILGRRISGYVEESDDDSVQKISQIAVENTETVVVTPQMFNRADGNTVSYYPSETSIQTENVDVSNVKVVYNGKYDPAFTAAEYGAVRSGQIEFICNNGDGNPEVAMVTDYRNYVVNSMDRSQDEPKVYAKYDAGELVIPVGSYGMFFSLTKPGNSGDAMSLAKGLKEWDVISVMKSKDSASGKAVWSGVITSQKVTGKISEKEDANRVKIGQKFYDFANSFIDYTGQKPAMEVGDYVTAYLDHEGKIAAASASQTDSSISLAYVITAEPARGMDGSAKLNLYGITGKTKQRIVTVASSVRVDGVTTDEEGALDALKTVAQTANAGKAEKGIHVSEYAQLIRYTTNASGEVDMIDTIAVNRNVGEDDLRRDVQYPLEGDPNKLLTYDAGRFNDGSNLKFITDASTKVLEIPASDYVKYDDYKIRTNSTAFTTERSYRVEAFNLGSTFTAKYVLSFVGDGIGLAGINEKSPMMLATEVSTVQGTDGIIDKVKGYAFPAGTEINPPLTSETSGLLSSNILLGDIFRYAVTDNQIVEIEKIVDFSTTEKPNKPTIFYLNPSNTSDPLIGTDIVAPVTLTDEQLASEGAAAIAADEALAKRFFQLDDISRSKSSTVGAFMFGTAVSYEDGKLAVTPTIAEDSTGIQNMAHLEIFNVNSAMVYVYDYSASSNASKVLKDSSIDAVGTYAKVGNNASQVLVYCTRNRNAQAILVFKY